MAKEKLSPEVKAKIQERLARLAKINCIDGGKIESRPTPAQQEVLDDYLAHKYKSYWVLGGNQCLVKGTLVATPTGPVKIEDIKVGDTVYSEHGTPIKVLRTFANGVKPVHTLTNRGVAYAQATEGHRFLVKDGHGRSHERNVYAFKRDDKVKRVRLQAPLGPVKVPDAYVVGAILGDGCCRQKTKGMHISSETSLIPDKCARLLNTSAQKLHENNYTWGLDAQCSHYTDWMKGLYAHEKIVNLSTIKMWDRQSLIAFIAGLYDTDGSLTRTRDIMSFSISMQAKSVLEAAEWAILALWGIPTQWHVDARAKYKNGPVYNLTIKNPHYIQQMMLELDAEVVSPQKKWDNSFMNTCGKRSSADWVGLTVSQDTELVETYDIHVDSRTNLYCLANGLVTHNSGKTALLRKVAAWFLAEGEPDIPWKRKENWEGPLQALLISKSHKQLTESVLPGILKFFGEDEIKIVKNANYVEKILHKKTGNTIICAVHENPSQARERVQSFTLHLVLLDELPAGPSAYKLIEELEARVMILKGCLLASFTPKSINKAVKDHVENMAPPVGMKYSLRFVDNPAADAEVIEARLAQISHLPEHMQKTLLEGTWATAESTVYTLTDYALQAPLHYSPLWRHTLGVDPGLASKQGFVVLAEDPACGKWYLIHSEAHDKIDDVDDGVRRVADYITRTQINVTKIIYDAAGTYWYMAARKHPVLKQYQIDKPFHKNSESRREDMISALQQALGSTLFIAPWNEDIIEEFGSYAWNDQGKIIKAQKYHMLDALRYAVDCLPKFTPNQGPSGLTIEQSVTKAMREYNEELRRRAAERREQAAKGKTNWRGNGNSSTWRGGRITNKR